MGHRCQLCRDCPKGIHAGGLIATDLLFVENFDQIVALAARHAIPVMHYLREYVAAGGREPSHGMSYSES